MVQGRAGLERLGPPVAALAAAAVLGGLLLFLRGGVNRPPVVTAMEVTPEVVPRGSTARVRVIAEDPDGDRLTFAYRAQFGRLDPEGTDPAQANYRAAREGPADRLTVVVTDARGLATTFLRAVTVQGAALPAAAPTPSPVPASLGAPIAVVPPAETLPAPRAASPPPAAAPSHARTNQPPLLSGGTTLHGLKDGVTALTVEGRDPDGDPITHKWDWGECAIAEAFDRDMADVRLKDGCDHATVVLTWTDSQGASTSTEWYLYR